MVVRQFSDLRLKMRLEKYANMIPYLESCGRVIEEYSREIVMGLWAKYSETKILVLETIFVPSKLIFCII